MVESNRVAVAEPGVELESEKDEEDWERKLDKTTALESEVGDIIARVDKLVE